MKMDQGIFWNSLLQPVQRENYQGGFDVFVSLCKGGAYPKPFSPSTNTPLRPLVFFSINTGDFRFTSTEAATLSQAQRS